jgi:hypothetical protein
VVAVQHGVVLDVRDDPQGYGRSVLLGHRWGQTFYGHLSEVRVQPTQQVGASQIIGLSGKSGLATTAHLHFGMRLIPYAMGDSWCGFIDPAPYLARLTEPRGAIMGPHLIGGLRPHLELLARWQPRLITVLDPNPDEVAALREACPDSVIIARLFADGPDLEERIRTDPITAANWAHELVRARLTPAINYWQVANEVLQEIDDLPLLNKFELARMRLAERAGYRCAILGFSVGNPDLPESDRMAAWRRLYPALERADRRNHVVAVHQYGMPDLWGPNNAYDWYALRLEHQVLRRLPYKRLKFAVTEFGIDGLIRGDQPAGWQTFTTPEGYVEQLLKCGRYLERYSGQVLGYTVFTLGHNAPWSTYDIAGKAATYLADLSEKGTWLEVDTQVFDIAPRETDTDTDPGPEAIEGGLAAETPTAPVDEAVHEGSTPAATDDRGTLEELARAAGIAAASELPALEPEAADTQAVEAAAAPQESEAADETLPLPAVPALQEPSAEPLTPVEPEGAPQDAETAMMPGEEDTQTMAAMPVAQAEPPQPSEPEPSEEPQPAEEVAVPLASSEAGGAGEPPEPPPAAEPEQESGPLVEQRIADQFRRYNMSIKSIPSRPDQPGGDVVFLVKDIFMTFYGSWEDRGVPDTVPDWARTAYLRPEFLEAGADHHLFAAVIGLDGQFLRGHEVIFWSDGFERLGDPTYQGFSRERTKESSGWSNIFMAGGSSYWPEAGESGPWCWAPAGAAEVVCGGGLPQSHPVSTFVVWQAVPRAQWEETLEEEPVPGEPTQPGEPGTPPPGRPLPTVETRASQWVSLYNVSIKPLSARPDKATGDVLYLVRDIFTTRDGSWEPSDLPGSIPEWARDEYLKPANAPDYFEDAGGAHHLYAAVIGLDGKLVRQQPILYWSDGFEVLGDPEYDAYIRRFTKERSGWTNIVTGPGSSYIPERGESGPWCWTPSGAAEVVCGGGLPANLHISFFVVWQAVANPDSGQPDTGDDHDIYLPTIPGVPPITARTIGVTAPELNAIGAEVLRQAMWQRLGIEFRADSVLGAYARKLGLGMPLTQEFEVGGLRAQGFQGGIVYATVHNGNRVGYISW